MYVDLMSTKYRLWILVCYGRTSVSSQAHFYQKHSQSLKSSRIKYLVRYQSNQMVSFNVRFALKHDRWLDYKAITISTEYYDYEILNRNHLLVSRIHKI